MVRPSGKKKKRTINVLPPDHPIYGSVVLKLSSQPNLLQIPQNRKLVSDLLFCQMGSQSLQSVEIENSFIF